MKNRTLSARSIITMLVLAGIIRPPQDGWWGDIRLCAVRIEIGEVI